MFMNGTENRKTGISLILRALKNAGLTPPAIELTPDIPKVSRPTAVEFLKAMQKADGAGKDYAEDKAVQALVARQILSQVNLYAAAEEDTVNEQLEILIEARDDLHAELEAKFDAAAATMTRHAAVLTSKPLLSQAEETMRSGKGGPASEAYAAYLEVKQVQEAWMNLHATLNGTSLNGAEQAIVSISTPTVEQMQNLDRFHWDAWEMAHQGITFSLAKDMQDVRDRLKRLEDNRRSQAARDKNRGAMSAADSKALNSAFNTHADTYANKVEQPR